MHKPHKFFFIFLLAVNSPIYADSKTNLTIYNNVSPGSISPDLYRPIPNDAQSSLNISIPGYAIVRENREVDLREGRNTVSFSDIAAFIDPTTVIFKSLTDAKATVVDQDYHFDLVNNQKLLERYLGQSISIEQSLGDKIESFSGKLLSTSGGIILEDDTHKIISLNNYSNIRFPDLPGGLTTKPTLVWNILASKAGKHQTETSYQTSNMTWWADYNAIYEETNEANKGFLDLSAWVSIINKSGASYKDTTLKLIAGDLNRVNGSERRSNAVMAFKTMGSPKNDGFAEKSFFEFHLYTLNRKTTITDNSTKQIELFPMIKKVPVKKEYIYNGASGIAYYATIQTEKEFGIQLNNKVETYLKFKNDKQYNLGMPLPMGRVRVSKIDSDNASLEFIGEDIINHTPKDEEVRIKMGNAFDIVGERKQVNFTLDTTRNSIEETFEITIKNHKNQDINVTVVEPLYRSTTWQIQNNSSEYQKADAQSIFFPVTVRKESETKLHYTVRYTW
jgi:hypothetical protein